jgi:uncharacterized delta-60 repeat protein
MKVDASGNVYVTGSTIGTSTDLDYLTAKYNTNGVMLWASIFNGPVNYYDVAGAIAVDNSGYVYVTGQSTYTGQNYDYTTIKYYPNGDTVWTRRYDSPGSGSEIGRAVAVDQYGNVYVTGSSMSTATNMDFITVKYNSSGVQQWTKNYNGPVNREDIPYAIALDNAGNIYVAGYCQTSTSYPYNYDYVTIKYFPTGDTAWLRRYNGPGNSYDAAYAMIADSVGNVYVTGTSVSSGTNVDCATIKYNSQGILQWTARYNGTANGEDYGRALVTDDSGNVYVTGYSTGSGTNLDYITLKYNSAGVFQIGARYEGTGEDRAAAITIDAARNIYVTGYSVSTTSFYDYCTIKYNSNCMQQWIVKYNGPANYYDEARAIGVDASGNVYVTGSSGTQYNWDCLTIKYSQNPGIEENRLPLSADHLPLQLFPNPASSVVRVRCPSSADIRIYDITGKVVKEIGDCFADARNDNTARVPLDEIKNGVYFVQVGDIIVKEKLVVLK